MGIPITIANLYLHGIMRLAHGLPRVQPEVLMAACRVLAAIDHGEVEMEIEREHVDITFRGLVLVRLREQVPCVSVMAIVSVSFNSPEEILITRKPLHDGIAKLAHMRISQIDESSAS